MTSPPPAANDGNDLRARAEERVGALLRGKYRLDAVLGVGGMGSVYAATHRNQKRFAVKVLHPELAVRAATRQRFVREGYVANSLRHPGAVAILDDDVCEDGAPFLVMELLEGVTLERLAKATGGRLPVDAALATAHQLLDVLAAAHARAIVHRDIKPANVFVQRDGAIKVLDFGIARMLEDAGASATSTGTLLGTPAFMAPEQAAGEIRKVSGRTDVWAVAATLFGLLSGELVRNAESAQQVVILAATKPVRSLAAARPDLAPELIALVDRALAFEPADRPSAEEMRDELARLHEAAFGAAPSREPLAALVARLEEEGALPRAMASPRSTTAPSTEDEPTPGAESTEGAEPSVWRPMGGTTAQSVSKAVTRADAPAPLRRPRRRALWGVAGVLVLAAGGLALARRAATHAPAPTDSIHAAVSQLAGPDARLACPILETQGVPQVGVRIGAAVAMLACSRLAWEIGGRDDRVLPPAALLDVPPQPSDDFADPYAAPEQRARTIAAAKARAQAYVDGHVTHDPTAWTIELVLRTPDDREIARSRGVDAGFATAVRRASEGLWGAPLVRRPIDPEVARWTPVKSADLGVLESDVTLFMATSGCGTGGFGADTPATSTSYFAGLCDAFGAERSVFDAGALAIDESSPEALAVSLRARRGWSDPPPIGADDGRRLAAKLEAMRAAEGTKYGRARLALEAGLLWSDANESERAQAALLGALRDDPMLFDAWEGVVRPDAAVPLPGAAAVASAWFPAEATFLPKATSWRGDELDARLRDARLAFLFDPRLSQAMYLGRALAEAGRAEDARAIAATPMESAEESRRLEAYVLAIVALHDAKLARAIERLESTRKVGLVDLLVAADVAGRADEVASRWAAWFLALPNEEAGYVARASHAPMVLCMRAAGGAAKRCLDRIEALGRQGRNWWYEGGTALLAGARRYAAGDFRGAAAAWRPLVAGTNLEIVRLLPTEAFERAGEHDLAARLDARKMAFTVVAGVSDAAPREAERALARGDRTKARDLASAVVQAWEVADVTVPAVERMRALLPVPAARP